MGIGDRPVARRSPWQNGYVERSIGSIRRECLDQMLVLAERHLRRVLDSYARYYNEARTYLALGKDMLKPRPIGRTETTEERPILGELYHKYAWIWFSAGTRAR